jgi:hypothetical protein
MFSSSLTYVTLILFHTISSLSYSILPQHHISKLSVYFLKYASIYEYNLFFLSVSQLVRNELLNYLSENYFCIWGNAACVQHRRDVCVQVFVYLLATHQLVVSVHCRQVFNCSCFYPCDTAVTNTSFSKFTAAASGTDYPKLDFLSRYLLSWGFTWFY